MAAAMAEKKGLNRLDAKNTIRVFPMAFAAGDDPAGQTISQTLTAEESISRCAGESGRA